MSSLTSLYGGGGGGGTPINGVAKFNTTDHIFTDENDQVWVRGAIQKDTTTYPDANFKKSGYYRRFFINAQGGTAVDYVKYVPEKNYFLIVRGDSSSFVIYFHYPEDKTNYNWNDINNFEYYGFLQDLTGTEVIKRGNGELFNTQITTRIYDVVFKTDGSKFYILGDSGIFEYDSVAAYEITGYSYSGNSLTGINTSARSFYISNDGLKLYLGLDANSGNVLQYSLSTAWDLSTASYDSVVYSAGDRVRGIGFNYDGKYMFTYGTNTDQVRRHTLSTAWDLSTASYISSTNYSININPRYGVAFDPINCSFIIAYNDSSNFHFASALDECMGNFNYYNNYNEFTRIK